mmetsp:Transcript_28708/g.93280  ORF Transcript_28708/g.93280 Transcript_28708/m.93280 type:complete len:246 (+) Transcript_28708:254-991(+)
MYTRFCPSICLHVCMLIGRVCLHCGCAMCCHGCCCGCAALLVAFATSKRRQGKVAAPCAMQSCLVRMLAVAMQPNGDVQMGLYASLHPCSCASCLPPSSTSSLGPSYRVTRLPCGSLMPVMEYCRTVAVGRAFRVRWKGRNGLLKTTVPQPAAYMHASQEHGRAAQRGARTVLSQVPRHSTDHRRGGRSGCVRCVVWTCQIPCNCRQRRCGGEVRAGGHKRAHAGRWLAGGDCRCQQSGRKPVHD